MFKPFDQSIQLSPQRIRARGLSLLSETNDKTFVYKENKTDKLHRIASGKTSGTGSEAALARGLRQPLVSGLTFVEGAEWGMLDSCAKGSGAAADRGQVLGNVMNRLLNASLYSANPLFQGFFQH